MIVVLAPPHLTTFRDRVGQTFSFVITGTTGGSVWGTDIYTDDSHVAVAAVHAGIVLPGQTKTIRVIILNGSSTYTGSTQNGVISGSYGTWIGSYSFINDDSTLRK
jgi:hypothetical protein